MENINSQNQVRNTVRDLVEFQRDLENWNAQMMEEEAGGQLPQVEETPVQVPDVEERESVDMDQVFNLHLY